MKKTLFIFAALTIVVLFVVVRGNRARTFSSNSGVAMMPDITSQNNISSDHILIGLRDNVRANEHADVLKRNHLVKKSSIDDINVDIVTIDPAETPQQVIARLEKEERGAIEFAEVDRIVTAQSVPNDSDYGSEWHLAKINAPTAWDTTHGEGIIIGIADTGVDASHPDLADHIVPGWNVAFDSSDTNDVFGHGTAVAGVAAAIGNNSLGVAGVAYNAQIMPIKISNDSGQSATSLIAKGILYAARHGVKVLNLSFAPLEDSPTIRRAAHQLSQKGGIFVNAAGSFGPQNLGSPYADDDIITVSGTDQNDVFFAYSTYGPSIDISAPAVSIFTTIKGGGYGWFGGTSASAPIVSGVVALMLSANPSLKASEVKTTLFGSAVDLGPTGWDIQYGWGRVDAAGAVALAVQARSGHGKKN